MDQFGMFQEEVEHTPLDIPKGAIELTDDCGVYKVSLIYFLKFCVLSILFEEAISPKNFILKRKKEK